MKFTFSIIDGTGNYAAYTFYNWGGIDIFIYFSHHLITIPPLSWINVAHAHGVKVLGRYLLLNCIKIQLKLIKI